MKRNNVVTKFKSFWDELDKEEKKELWKILTALRGNDDSSSKYHEHEKCLTTARIRGELFEAHSFEPGIEGYSYPSYSRIPDYAKKRTREVTRPFRSACFSHFHSHIRSAIRILNKYRPEKNMRDLQKFFKTEELPCS